ncbi:MAG: hypothetical protein WCX17_04230 [Parcubacteria group bacterium]
MSSRNTKIIISIIILLAVIAIVAFGLRKGSQPSSIGDGQKTGNTVVESPEDFKQNLINDDMSDPAVSQDDIENEDNPALDVPASDDDTDTDTEPIIEDPEAEKL